MDSKTEPASEAKGFEGHIPGKRCKMNGDEIYICHIIEGNEALDYEGKCYGCGAKRAITFDEDNQTEADAARAYLIKEGLDPDQLVKEGLVFIKAIQDLLIAQEEITRLKAELERERSKNSWNDALDEVQKLFKDYLLPITPSSDNIALIAEKVVEIYKEIETLKSKN